MFNWIKKQWRELKQDLFVEYNSGLFEMQKKYVSIEGTRVKDLVHKPQGFEAAFINSYDDKIMLSKWISAISSRYRAKVQTKSYPLVDNGSVRYLTIVTVLKQGRDKMKTRVKKLNVLRGGSVFLDGNPENTRIAVKSLPGSTTVSAFVQDEGTKIDVPKITSGMIMVDVPEEMKERPDMRMERMKSVIRASEQEHKDVTMNPEIFGNNVKETCNG